MKFKLNFNKKQKIPSPNLITKIEKRGKIIYVSYDI